jgi:hypothetical protein
MPSQNIYNGLRCVLRLWRAIQFNKCSGKLHELNNFIPGRNASDYTVICPACPIPNINFDPNDLPGKDDPKWFIYEVFYNVSNMLLSLSQVPLQCDAINQW